MYYNYVDVINVHCMYKYIQHTYKYICILDKCNMQTNKYVKHICIFSHIDCILLSKYTTYVSLKYIQTNTLFFPVHHSDRVPAGSSHVYMIVLFGPSITCSFADLLVILFNYHICGIIKYLAICSKKLQLLVVF